MIRGCESFRLTAALLASQALCACLLAQAPSGGPSSPASAVSNAAVRLSMVGAAGAPFAARADAGAHR